MNKTLDHTEAKRLLNELLPICKTIADISAVLCRVGDSYSWQLDGRNVDDAECRLVARYAMAVLGLQTMINDREELALAGLLTDKVEQSTSMAVATCLLAAGSHLGALGDWPATDAWRRVRTGAAKSAKKRGKSVPVLKRDAVLRRNVQAYMASGLSWTKASAKAGSELNPAMTGRAVRKRLGKP